MTAAIATALIVAFAGTAGAGVIAAVTADHRSTWDTTSEQIIEWGELLDEWTDERRTRELRAMADELPADLPSQALTGPTGEISTIGDGFAVPSQAVPREMMPLRLPTPPQGLPAVKRELVLTGQGWEAREAVP